MADEITVSLEGMTELMATLKELENAIEPEKVKPVIKAGLRY